METVCIKIQSWKITGDKVVTVVLPENNHEIDLPISESRLYSGGRVSIPAWLYRKISRYESLPTV